MDNCPSCDSIVNESYNFCPVCGISLDADGDIYFSNTQLAFIGFIIGYTYPYSSNVRSNLINTFIKELEKLDCPLHDKVKILHETCNSYAVQVDSGFRKMMEND